MECPETTDVDLRKGITVAAWFRSDQGTRAQVLLAKGDAWRLQQNAQGALEFVLSGPLQERAPRPRPLNLVTPNRTADGQWHHVAATYNGSRAVLYLDGVEAAAVVAAGPVTVNNSPISVGDPAEPRSGGVGLLEDARVYTQSLGAAEVQALSRE